MKGNILCYQLRINLRLPYFKDINDNVAFSDVFFKIFFKLINFRPFFADDDTRARRIDVDLGFICRSLYINVGDTGMI